MPRAFLMDTRLCFLLQHVARKSPPRSGGERGQALLANVLEIFYRLGL